MKLKFKVQPYQTSAVESVVDCFAGQVNTSGIVYRIDTGRTRSQRKATFAGYTEQTMMGSKPLYDVTPCKCPRNPSVRLPRLQSCRRTGV
jgi:hypothetical protein